MEAKPRLLGQVRDRLQAKHRSCRGWTTWSVRDARPAFRSSLSQSEVRALLERLDGQPRLMAELMYGSGLRLMETLPAPGTLMAAPDK